MDSFFYIAHDLAGVEQRGIRKGISSEEIYAWLNKVNLIPVEVRLAELETHSTHKKLSIFHKRPKPADMAAFCWQLATMIEGGVIITEAIDTIATDTENVFFREVLVEVSENIKKGSSFSGSTAKFPKVFNKLFCAMILAAETSGSLPVILGRLAEYFDKRDKFVKKVRTALAYPLFVVGFVFFILIIMMTVIIPKFRLIFDQMGGELPPFTRAFMSVYDVFSSNALYIVGSVVILVVSLVLMNKTRRGHIFFCNFALAFPLLGKLSSQAFYTTFCRTMSTLLNAGVSIIEAFDIIADMTPNDVIKHAVVRSKDHIIEGSSISMGMAATGFFPTMVAKMVDVGERSGSLPAVLEKAGSYYETKLDATINTLLSLLGPIVIIVVGGIVLVVVVALYLPIFSMSDVKM